MAEDQFVYRVSSPPRISDIPDQVTSRNSPIARIPFTVGDNQTDADSLRIEVSSSNPSIIGATNIILSGFGAERSISIIPAANATGASTITVQVRDAHSEVASESFSVTVLDPSARRPQTITMGAVPEKVLGDAPFALSASASSGLPVSFSIVSGPGTISGNLVTLTGIGTVILRASQAGNQAYEAAPSVETSFMVRAGPRRQGQTISFTVQPERILRDSPVALTARASSGLPVALSVVSGPATISSNVVTLTGTGSVTVRAVQEGNLVYAAAPSVDRTFVVKIKRSQTISFAPLTDRIVGDPPSVLSASASSGLPVSFSVVSGPVTVSGDKLTVTGMGTVIVRASQGGDDLFDAAPNVGRSFAARAIQTGSIHGDFNQDGVSDILFRDDDGYVAAWFMKGTVLDLATFLWPRACR